MSKAKTSRLFLLLLVVVLLAFGTGLVAWATTCGPSVIPVFFEGNPPDSIAPVGGAVQKIEAPVGGSFNVVMNGVTYTVNVVTDTDGKYLSFTTVGGFAIVSKVTVKGGPNANIYTYNPAVSSDCNLVSPLNDGGNIPQISHVDFVFTPPDIPVRCETAWAAGTRYVEKGNWATYTTYNTVEKTVTLFAGQTENVGTVVFSEQVEGYVRITITLTGGWKFNANTEESVKIQNYAVAPSGNPAPGQFDHKFNASGSSWSEVVPVNNFYGVHVDVCK